MQMQGIPWDVYPTLAHLIRPTLEKFTEDGAHTVDDLEARIAARDMQCWIGGEGRIQVVCLTEIVPDRLKTCHIGFCAGENFPDWVPLIEGIAAFARGIGCARLRLTARPGYTKFLVQHGFRQTHIVLDRSL